MTTQITAETISPITHNSLPVITTELLAKLYGTDTDNIKKNYSRNQGRFIVGKHFFKISGKELSDLRVTLSHSQNPVSPKTRFLILWTERGAARHAKMLETDQAWEVFEKLEDCYFNQKEKQAKSEVPVAREKQPECRYRVRVIIYDDLLGGAAELLGKGETLRNVAEGIATDLGYKPNAFTHVPMNRDKVKRIH